MIQVPHAESLPCVSPPCRILARLRLSTEGGLSASAASSIIAPSPHARLRLTPRCNGRHLGNLFNILASGVQQPRLQERSSVARSLLKYSGNPILRASNPKIEGLPTKLLLLHTSNPLLICWCS